MINPVPDSLRRAAQQAATDRFFLASALRVYQQAQRLDDAALADFIGCDPADLPRLGLCRCPSTEELRGAVEYLARRFRLRADRLANLLRQVEFIEALRLQRSPEGAGFLLAARDREEIEPPWDAEGAGDR